jgi:hypothetical protein
MSFVIVGLCHSNDSGLLWLCSPFAIRVLALLFFLPFILKNIAREPSIVQYICYVGRSEVQC